MEDEETGRDVAATRAQTGTWQLNSQSIDTTISQ